MCCDEDDGVIPIQAHSYTSSRPPGICGTMLGVRAAGEAGDGTRCWVSLRSADASFQKVSRRRSRRLVPACCNQAWPHRTHPLLLCASCC